MSPPAPFTPEPKAPDYAAIGALQGPESEHGDGDMLKRTPQPIVAVDLEKWPKIKTPPQPPCAADRPETSQ